MSVTRYVDPLYGNDSNSGASDAAPWATFAKVAASPLPPGSTLFLRSDRTFYETLELPETGTPDFWINVTSYGSGDRPVVDSEFIRSFGFTMAGNTRSYIAISNINFINAVDANANFNGGVHTVENCDFVSCMDQNVQNQGSSIVTYNNCTFADAGDDGSSFHNTTTVVMNDCTFTGNVQNLNSTVSGCSVTLNRCRIENAETNNILMHETTTFVANDSYIGKITTAGNSILAHGTLNACVIDGSDFPTQSTGLIGNTYSGKTLTLKNCTIWGGANLGAVSIGATSTMIFENSIIKDIWRLGATAGLDLRTNKSIVHGVTISNVTTSTNPVSGNPLLVNPAAENFAVSTGSPAIAAGATTSILRDYLGNLFNNPPTIGAVEYNPLPEIVSAFVHLVDMATDDGII